MAGKLIVDTIDTDNAFITLNVQQSTIATMNVSGIYSNTGVKMIGANGSVSNTAITGVITGSQLASNTVSNTNIQTGAVENYMNAAGLGFGMRNRIINGGMVIDQRNAGASVTPTDQSYTLDRWSQFLSQSSKLTIQQNAGSVTPPAGFTNYLGVTSTSSYSVTSSDYFNLYQFIEGFNVDDLSWGSANAKTVTLSFWVRSSLTGTFGGSLMNSGNNRSYPYTYTISSANTWEQKTITIAGDTSGTWLTTNGVGLRVFFGLGMGSSLTGPAGAWAGAAYYGANGATSVVGTNGATFYITGVQLEKGSTATSFDYRDYGRELQMCQRYYLNYGQISCSAYSSQGVVAMCSFPVTMRASPTISISYGGVANRVYTIQTGGTADIVPSMFNTASGLQYFYYLSGSWATGAGTGIVTNLTASIEL